MWAALLLLLCVLAIQASAARTIDIATFVITDLVPPNTIVPYDALVRLPAFLS
jgi:hypothetical protein